MLILCVFCFQSVLKDLWAASKLVSCKGKRLGHNHMPHFTILTGLSDWVPSINNMLWYSFSTCAGTNYTILLTVWLSLARIYRESFFYRRIIMGDPELLKEKLLSIPSHVSNDHAFPLNKKYSACPHPPLVGDREKAWLLPGSLVRFLWLGYYFMLVGSLCPMVVYTSPPIGVFQYY